MKFSVIIPTFRRHSDLCLCLTQLSYYFDPFPLEDIQLMDQAGSFGAKRLTKRKSKLELLHIATGTNRGVKYTGQCVVQRIERAW
jgi:hypothetical protein